MTSTKAIMFDTRSEVVSASRKQNFVGFGDTAAAGTLNNYFITGRETDGAE